MLNLSHFLADFHTILEIRLGQNTKAFEVQGKRPEYEERSFSIIYFNGTKYGMLDFGNYI